MTQVVARLDDALAADLDALVASGVVASRSEGIRVAIERFVDEHRRAEVGRQIVAGYVAVPQDDDDGLWSDDQTIAMIEAEPW
ncbi:ribbon-helix-helix protein, CopG family [Aquihabitans sp. McL0605]|uniref:ribbon-helix-helix protein, CopG family n=1 Tax=Aquihabitans sp. McL0605 TaxID=3415671 RepID=UPI003CF38806